MDSLVPLIDGDLLVYEISVLGDFIDENEEHIVLPFSYLEEIVNNRIESICTAVGTSEAPVIYLTGKGNFRYEIAKTKPYKGNRTTKKPIHLENMYWYLISRYDAIVVNGMEADDALGIHQYMDIQSDIIKNPKCNTVICSRDKDLKQIPGWHYGWEVGSQPEQRLHFVYPLGALHASYKEGFSTKTGKETKSFHKLNGEGYLWFCAQTLIGDTTDNIPGLVGCGGKQAYEDLHGVESELDALKVVISKYKETYGDAWKENLEEQVRLVWICREYDEDGSGKPKMWELPECL
jgi:hypothetical protein